MVLSNPAVVPWPSLVVVKKGDGSYRPCCYYRQLNAATKPDRYPLPISDLGTARESSFGYHALNVGLDESLPSNYNQPRDIEKTAVTTSFGLFE